MSNRPRSVTFLIWGVFLLGVWNLLRAFVLGEQSALLRNEGVMIDPALRLGISLLWTALFGVLAVALWHRRSQARRWLIICLLVYVLYSLLLQMIFAQTPAARQSWPAALALHLAMLVYVIWALYRPANRAYWIQQYEMR